MLSLLRIVQAEAEAARSAAARSAAEEKRARAAQAAALQVTLPALPQSWFGTRTTPSKFGPTPFRPTPRSCCREINTRIIRQPAHCVSAYHRSDSRLARCYKSRHSIFQAAHLPPARHAPMPSRPQAPAHSSPIASQFTVYPALPQTWTSRAARGQSEHLLRFC